MKTEKTLTTIKTITNPENHLKNTENTKIKTKNKKT